MTSKFLLTSLALVLSASTLVAQGTPGTPRPATAGQGSQAGGMGRGQMRGLTPEQREAARQRAQQHHQSLTPEQQEAMKAWRTAMQEQRKTIMDQVRAGTLTREQARERLQAWMQANKPPVAPPERPNRPAKP